MKSLRLHILRHSDAAEPGEAGVNRDFDRPLTRVGKRKAERVARGLRKRGVRFDLILSSPAVRARETAEIVVAELRDNARLKFTDNLLIGSSRDRLYKELSLLSAKIRMVLLVGHEPFLGNLVSHLLIGRTGLPLCFKKAGLCRMEVTGLPSHPRGTLEWLATAKLLGVS